MSSQEDLAPAVSGEPSPQAVPVLREERIRVLLLIKGLGLGGAERLLVLAARHGDRAAFSYETAYLLPWKDALREEMEQWCERVHCLEGGKEWDLRWAARLRTLLRERRPHIVHVHSPYVAGIARLVVRSLPRMDRPRVISTEHLWWSGYSPPTRVLNGVTFFLDDMHVAVSRPVMESIPAFLRKKVQVVVHGPDLPRLIRQLPRREEARAELNVGPDEFLIGTVGNNRPQKGYPDLLVAARRIIDMGLPVRFVAIGEGVSASELGRQHRDLGLGDRFLLLGRLDEPETVIAGCDLFVLASLFEGLPIALMEALALGIPVVATNVPGTQEAVRNGVEGLLVPPSRPDLMAQAIATLIDKPELRRQMAEAAFHRARDFDIEIAVESIEAIYHELMNGKGAMRWPAKRRQESGGTHPAAETVGSAPGISGTEI